VQPSQVSAGQDVTVSISFDANPSLHHPAASYQVIATDGGAPVTSFLWPSFVIGNLTDTLLFSSKPEQIGITRDKRGAIKGRISHTFAQTFQIPASAALRRAVYVIVNAAEFFDDGTFFFEVGSSDYLRQCVESKGPREKPTDCVFKTPALIARQKATGSP
jgi:hypothetical protein